MITHKRNRQFFCWNLVHFLDFRFVNTGITIDFIKIINVQMIFR